jgi:hypothetical protein
VGWESRQRGGSYYYKPARINGKPRRIYCGFGTVGRIHELLDRGERREKLVAAQARHRVKSQLEETDRIWTATWRWLRPLMMAHMLAAGFYSHHRSWRRVMQKPRTRKRKPRLATPEEVADLRAKLMALNERANTGDVDALIELKAFLDEHPEVWRMVGDLNRVSTESWTTVLANGDALHKESFARFANEWKSELVGPDASATEKALADAAAVARLALTHAERLAARESGSTNVAALKVKRLNAASHRFTMTLKLLVQVRSTYPKGLSSPASVAVGLPRLYPGTSGRKKVS